MNHVSEVVRNLTNAGKKNTFYTGTKWNKQKIVINSSEVLSAWHKNTIVTPCIQISRFAYCRQEKVQCCTIQKWCSNNCRLNENATTFGQFWGRVSADGRNLICTFTDSDFCFPLAFVTFPDSRSTRKGFLKLLWEFSKITSSSRLKLNVGFHGLC